MGTINSIIINGVTYDVGGSGSGLTEDVKSALLQLAEKVAYIDDDGQDYYSDLEDALYPPAPPASVSYITCVYTQSGTVYPTDSLNSLKSDLVVTAHYTDSTTGTVNGYTLSGTLTTGTSTITVTYSGKTTTFNVTVSASASLGVLSQVRSGEVPTFTANGDGTYTASPNPSTIVATTTYYTVMAVSSVKGGTLYVNFDSTYKSGDVSIFAIASETSDMSKCVGVTKSDGSWNTESMSWAVHTVGNGDTLPMLSGCYTWLFVRGSGIIMGDDSTGSNDKRHGYIVDGHITFTIR